MVQEIQKYIREMRGVTNRTDVLKSISNTSVNINKSVIPTLSKSIEFFKKLPTDIDSIKIAKDLNNYSNINAKDIPELLTRIKDLYSEIAKNEVTLNKLVTDNFTELISSGNLTAREVTILKVIDDTSDMTLYIHDYLYLLVNRHPKVNEEEIDPEYLTRPKVNEIYRALYTFASTIKTYREFSTYLKNVSKVADVNVKEDSNTNLVTSYLAKLGKTVLLPNVKGFRANPIFHFRMWLVDRDIKKLENLKDKQKMTELKILELQNKNDGSDSAKLTKQVKYYENKLNTIEYKIRRIEED